MGMKVTFKCRLRLRKELARLFGIRCLLTKLVALACILRRTTTRFGMVMILGGLQEFHLRVYPPSFEVEMLYSF